MQGEVRHILEQLNKADFFSTLEELDMGCRYGMPDEKYWARALKDARAAELLKGLTAEERAERLAEGKKLCEDELRRANNCSCMLWEQLCEGEEYEIDPIVYWENLAKGATKEADAYEYAKYAGASKKVFNEESARGIDIALKKDELTAILAKHNTNGEWPAAWWKFNLNYEGGERFVYTTRSVLVGLIKALRGTVENTDQWWDELKAAHGQ